MHQPTPQDATLDLLLQLERLLAEADRARLLRDRLLDVARSYTPPTTASTAGRREAATRA